MTRRLTLLFSAATLLILLSASALLHWRLSETLESEDETIMRENLMGLGAIWATESDPLPALEQKINLEIAGVRQEPYFIRYLRDGVPVMETPGMETLLPPGLFPTASPPGEGELMRLRTPDGTLYLLLTEGVGAAPGHAFQSALDVTHDDHLLRGYARDLMATVLLGTILATLAGAVTARRGLRPLARMSDWMSNITVGRLDRRIGGESWPRELAELAAVFDGMMGRLEDSFTRLSRYSADLAHEIRTPLTNLRSEAEVTLARARSGEEYRAVVESSLEEYGRLSTLVDRLLFLARADVGATVLDLQTLEAHAEVEAVREFFSASAEEKGVLLRCTGRARVRADPVLLRRVLVNLMANALEHTPQGGVIHTHVALRGDLCAIDMADTGTGIPPGDLPRVTERFYRVEGGPARDHTRPGAGLGLSLVTSIVRLHGGSARITSVPGDGTRVSLLFPTAAASPPESTRPPAPDLTMV